METSLSIAVIEGGDGACVVARHRNRLAIERVPNPVLSELASFRAVLERAVLGAHDRPTADEIAELGRKLHDVLFSGDVGRLYSALADVPTLSVEILGAGELVQRVPWEFLVAPDDPAGPRRGRPIVRIVAVPELDGSSPGSGFIGGERQTVLFAAAEPDDQRPVPWEESQRAIEQAFGALLEPGTLDLQVVEAASRASLHAALTEHRPTILHFSGHGVVEGGRGHLLLRDRSGGSEPLDAETLALMLRDLPIRLVVLSACETAVGEHDRPFAVLAETLVRFGVPAVVASQFPLPRTTVIVQTAALYNELVRSGNIDSAITEARLELCIGRDAGFEWGIPTLHRLTGAAQLFAPAPPPATNPTTKAEKEQS